jgi:eukaryotic-like serine/threonine-protein kinase
METSLSARPHIAASPIRSQAETALPKRMRLGTFEVDLRAGELQTGNQTVRLQEQPFRILLILIEHAGETVSREEIQKRLWPNDTVVDWDHSINTAVKKLRQALGDSPDHPRFIETLVGRGYRLLMTPQAVAENARAAADLDQLRRQRDLPLLTRTGDLLGKRVSHYRVLELLGGGGMGMVYKAEDLKLGRSVALKFLPDELASDSVALKRFQREARTASAIDHPNICTVYEVEEHEGQPFLVMQFLQGQTLRDRLATVMAEQKTLPIEELVDVAIQICSGLEAADKHGIIHRDIKPGNIFLTTSGLVKILDFGLAKLANAIHEAGSDTLLFETDALLGDPAHPLRPGTTCGGTGFALGTAGYMSPEQARGEKLDRRSDIFSFGAVLYEMATGQRAFPGLIAGMAIDAVLTSTPAPVRALNSQIPPALEAIVHRALKKNREQRYQSASGLGEELARVRAEFKAPAISEIPKPARDLNGGAEQRSWWWSWRNSLADFMPARLIRASRK